MRWTSVNGLICAGVVAMGGAARASEICGNGIDDDGNGMADEDCYPSMSSVCESPLSCSDPGWVSWSTGSIHYDLPPDVAPKSPYGHDIPFRRFYTSQYAPDISSWVNTAPLGPRWQHNYMSWIHMQDDPLVAALHTPDGRDVVFNATGSTGIWVYYAPQAGQHYQYLRRRNDKMFFELKTLVGDTLLYDTNGRLIEVWDAVAEPNTNKVVIDYTGYSSGNVDTVTDATGARRLKFDYTNDLLTSVSFQLRSGTSWTTYHTTSYTYANGALGTVTIGGQFAQTNVYANGNLTRIDDGDGKQIIAFQYASPG